MIKVKPGASVKEAFKLAEGLRKAGYISELDLDGDESGVRWVIEIQKDKPVLTLIDKETSMRFNADTLGELLRKREGKGGS